MSSLSTPRVLEQDDATITVNLGQAMGPTDDLEVIDYYIIFSNDLIVELNKNAARRLIVVLRDQLR